LGLVRVPSTQLKGLRSGFFAGGGGNLAAVAETIYREFLRPQPMETVPAC
jgi:hypothetical protein